MLGRSEYAAELAGSFLLLVLGLSAVTVNFAAASSVPSWIPNEHVRRPGRGWPAAVAAAELVMTLALVTLILHMVDRPNLMPFTPAAAGALVALLVFKLAPVSGTSLNPARSLGSAVAGHTHDHLWVYLIAPPMGALLAAAAFGRQRGSVRCGKLVHDDGYQ